MDQLIKDTLHRRIRQQLKRLDADLTSSIKELVEEAKQGNEDDTLEFLTNRVYIQEDQEEGDALWGINLKNGNVIYTPTNDDTTTEMPLEKIIQEIRLDILEDLCNGKYTTYKESN